MKNMFVNCKSIVIWSQCKYNEHRYSVLLRRDWIALKICLELNYRAAVINIARGGRITNVDPASKLLSYYFFFAFSIR